MTNAAQSEPDFYDLALQAMDKADWEVTGTLLVDVRAAQIARNAVRLGYAAALSSPVHPEPVPNRPLLILDEEQAALVRDTIGCDDDGIASPVTIDILKDGPEGPGVYIWLTEYPDEGCILLTPPAGPIAPYNLHDKVRSASAPAAVQTVPPGWKLVPVEPTDQMLAASDSHCHEGLLYPQDFVYGPRAMRYTEYQAMLAAAPTQPQGESDGR